jgi:hypothetical protein
VATRQLREVVSERVLQTRPCEPDTERWAEYPDRTILEGGIIVGIITRVTLVSPQGQEGTLAESAERYSVALD